MPLRKYECVMVIHPGTDASATEAIHERFTTSIKGHGGDIALTEDWGLRKLEYEIEDQTNAHYWFFKFTADQGLVEEADRDLRLDDRVIRHLIVRDEEWAERNRAAQAKRGKLAAAEGESHGS